VRLWEVATWKQKHEWGAPGGSACAVAFSPDDKIVAAACQGAVRLWNTKTGRIYGTFPGHGTGCSTVAFSPKGAMFVTGGNDNIVKAWELSSRKERWKINGHTGAVLSLAFSPDGWLLASCGYTQDGSVKLWDVYPAFPGVHR
jgi:WD40 repeat protein